MKKIISIILAVAFLCTGLAGCSDAQSGAPSAEITRYTTEGKVTKLLPDETLSGELSVNIDTGVAYSNEDLLKAEKLYNEYYPNVKLSVKKFPPIKERDLEGEARQLQAEIMAGKGPDVFLTFDCYSDVYKMMESGVYADLTEYFENDKNFNISDYAENVIYAGQFNGKQYLIPLSFSINGMMTTESIISDVGFDLEKCEDFISTQEEMLRVVKKNKPNCLPEHAVCGYGASYWFLQSIDKSWMDYSNDKVNLAGNEKIKKGFELAKEYLPYMWISPETGRPYEFYGQRYGSNFEMLGHKDSLLLPLDVTKLDMIIGSFRDFKAINDKMKLFHIKDFEGKTNVCVRASIGVKASSENIPAAYAFIKLLYSDEFLQVSQDERGNYHYVGEKMLGIPMKKSTFKEFAMKFGTSSDKTFDLQMKIIPSSYITEEEADEMVDFFYNVQTARFVVEAGYTLMDKMKPYLLNDGDYDACIKEMQNDAEIYVSE